MPDQEISESKAQLKNGWVAVIFLTWRQSPMAKQYEENASLLGQIIRALFQNGTPVHPLPYSDPT